MCLSIVFINSLNYFVMKIFKKILFILELFLPFLKRLPDAFAKEKTEKKESDEV